ncbi:MAG: glycosyl hydrolase family 17 protein [Pseudomonadota bacterium]
MPAHALPPHHPSLLRAAAALVTALLLALVLAACGGGGTVPVAGVQVRPLSAEFGTRKAVAYSPFRSANRDTETITAAMLREDLALLQQGGFTLLRLFDSSDAVAKLLLQVIAQDRLDFKVMLGAYILSESAAGLSAAQLANNRAFNLAEVERAVALANAYPDTVLAVSVGNEAMVVWSFVPSAPDIMAGYIGAVRSRISQPVTTDDNWAFFAKGASERYDPRLVLEAVDFVSMHTYPLLDTVPPAIANWDWQQQATAAGPARATAMMDAAIAAAKAEYTAVRAHMDSLGHGAKPIVVGETGWKAEASGGEFNRAHPANQKMYFDRLIAWRAASQAAGSGPVAIIYFEAFDEPWKGRDDKWGLFTVGRKARSMVQSLYPANLWDATYTEADAVYAATISSNTVTANRYTLYADAVTGGEERVSNLQFFGWDSPATSFSGEVTGTAADGEAFHHLEIAPTPAVYGWGHFATASASTDLSQFEAGGRLNFRIRTTYPGKLRFGFLTGTGNTAYDAYLTVSNSNADGYGFVNDGQWRDVSIPISAIKAAGAPSFGNTAATARFDLTKVTNPFVVNDVYDATGNTTIRGNTSKVYIDNIHWTK